MTWSNWSGAVNCRPAALAEHADEVEIAQIVSSLGPDARVRAFGSGHSFVDFWEDDQHLVGLNAHAGVESVRGQRAWIGAGTTIHALGPLLHAHGLALPTQGDIDRQTLAGAVSTGTHGTGTRFGNLSSRVTGMRLVDGRGNIRTLTDASQLRAARISLGMTGIITAIEMDLIPAFALHERNWREDHAPAVERFSERLESARHHEFWWVPAGDFCAVKTLEEIDPPEEPRLQEVEFGEVGERWGWSWQVFPSERDARFNEMEYAVPADAWVACFDVLRTRILREFPRLPWPVEVRWLPADDAWLSPTAGDAVVTLSVHQDARRDPTPLFDLLEPVLRDHGGRPHWGKRHRLSGNDVRSLYPALQHFEAVRAELDPQCIFTGRWLRDLFELGVG